MNEISKNDEPSGAENPPISDQEWLRALARAKEVAQENARQQVARMTDLDRQRYAESYNTPTDDPEVILQNKLEVSALHMTLSSAAGQSCLFRRLLKGKEPLEYPPPKRDGKSWYDTFDRPKGTVFPCVLTHAEPSRRLRDSDQNKWVVEINDCRWEARPDAHATQFLKALMSRDEVKLQQLLQLDPVDLPLYFGLWSNEWRLLIDYRQQIFVKEDSIVCAGSITRRT